MSVYFGKPALGLVTLAPPDRGLAGPSDRVSTIHTSSAGGRTVDLSLRTRRTYALSWKAIDPDTASVLEEFFTGARGRGPWVLLDPGRRNHLTTNQSAATAQTNDTTGFTVDPSSGELLASSSAPINRGPRALRWLLPGTITSGVLTFDPPFGLLGFPVPAGTTWTLSGMASSNGVAAGVTFTPTLSWRRIDGSELSTSTGTPTAVTSAAWSAWSVTGTVPAGALYVVPQLRVALGVLTTAAISPEGMLPTMSRPPRLAPAMVTADGGRPNDPLVPRPSIARPVPAPFTSRAPITTTDLLLDSLQLDLYGSVRAWVVGTGVPQVSITDMPETYHIVPYRNVSMTLVEIG